jgi:hypothetical protein
MRLARRAVMAPVTPNPPDLEAAFLRSEARFALTAGAILLIGGVACAAALSWVAMVSDTPGDAWAPALIALPPVAIGWCALTYAAWRLEQAQAVLLGRRPRRLFLRLSAKAVLQIVRRRVAAAPRAARAVAEGLADRVRRDLSHDEG